MLTDKNTGVAYEFRVYQEKDLSFLKAKNEKKKLIIDFNMKDLELEYDYATDLDQLHSAKKMLWQENICAIEFMIKEDPMLLVGNLDEEISTI